jgi:GDP-mannose 6-dehydrogenase
MKISVFGLGYVGIVAAACLRGRGHTVIGVDIVQSKIDAVNAGQAPVHEPGVNQLLNAKSTAPKVEATTKYLEAVAATDVSIVCVGTPALPSGHLDLSYLERVLTQIFTAANAKSTGHCVINRSSVVPGTHSNLILPLIRTLDPSGTIAYAYHPEFLREGQAVNDFHSPALHVVASTNGYAEETVNALFTPEHGDVFQADFSDAELLKYASNAFHALKVVFSGEVSEIAAATGADANKVLSMFRTDKHLNISGAYLRPGFAFGGSCLPKDTRALAALAERLGIETPTLSAINTSNDHRITRLLEFIERHSPASIGLWGITFKPDTDDIRGSPIIRVIDALFSSHSKYAPLLDVRIYDSQAATIEVEAKFKDQVHATNSEDEFVDGCDLVVLGPRRVSERLVHLLRDQRVPVIDLGYFDPIHNVEHLHCYSRF